MRPDVKICGVCRPDDAAMAVEAGATHIGLIRVPGAFRTCSEAEARAVVAAAAGARRVGVFVDAALADVRRELSALGLEVAQLHGAEPPETVETLQREGVEVWKVVKPATGAALLQAADRYAAADLLLVEGWSGRGHGGVGARFDWDGIEPAIRRLPSGLRVGVGGGLTPANVAEAVRRFAPALVDASSGVELSPGRKDAGLVRAFIEATV